MTTCRQLVTTRLQFSSTRRSTFQNMPTMFDMQTACKATPTHTCAHTRQQRETISPKPKPMSREDRIGLQIKKEIARQRAKCGPWLKRRCNTTTQNATVTKRKMPKKNRSTKNRRDGTCLADRNVSMPTVDTTISTPTKPVVLVMLWGREHPSHRTKPEPIFCIKHLNTS